MAKIDQEETKQQAELRRKQVGEVVSDKMNKTIVVKVTRTLKHPVFGKTISRFKKYKVHDEQELAKVGDMVEIVESRPLSKTKHMSLNRVLTKHV